MEKFKNKYRVQTTRLPYWNYGWNAVYFVTICTANRICHFGSIDNGIMMLSDLGRCAERCWLDIPNHFPFVVLHEFVVMPNHVHGILAIDKPVEIQDSAETQDLASLPPTRQNCFGPQSRNLASIIRGYKIGVSKYAKNGKINFAWQSRFHEHVIRKEEGYLRIAEYIQTNPQRWLEDTYYV